MEADVRVCVSKDILDEYGKVIRRDFSQLTESLPKLMENIFGFVAIVESTVKVDVVSDEDDNKIIECALEADAKYIITYDKALLKIKEYEGIKIVKPEEMMKILKGEES